MLTRHRIVLAVVGGWLGIATLAGCGGGASAAPSSSPAPTATAAVAPTATAIPTREATATAPPRPTDVPKPTATPRPPTATPPPAPTAKPAPTVARIVSASNGSVKLEGPPGATCTMTVTLPSGALSKVTDNVVTIREDGTGSLSWRLPANTKKGTGRVGAACTPGGTVSAPFTVD